MLLMFVFPIAMASHQTLAQEITVTLTQGWNWISYPNAEPMTIASALGSFVPMEGDMIKSQYNNSTFSRGRWTGGGHSLYPRPGLQVLFQPNRSCQFRLQPCRHTDCSDYRNTE